MPSVLFFTLLLFELKLPLLFGFPLLAGELLAFCLFFFVLLLQRLLRLRADARSFHLFSRVPLTAFGVVGVLLLLRLDRCGELQSAVLRKNELPDLSVGRLRAEGDLAYGQLTAVKLLKHAYPKRLVKIYRQF